MAYPGEGQRMASYGVREHDPEHVCGQWKEFNHKLNKIDRTHIAMVGDSSGLWKRHEGISEEDQLRAKSYYSNQKEPTDTSTSSYDSVFNVDYDFNSKLHRDDRQHRVGLNINAEETGRVVPVRSSSVYGRRVDQPLEMPNRQYVRTDKINKGFMRSNGVGIPKSSDAKCVGLIESS